VQERTTLKEYRYSVVNIAGTYFGIEVDFVQEVLLLPSITRVPNVSGSILGVFNLRGQIHSVIDVRGILHLSESRGVKHDSFVVVIEYNKKSFGLLVEKVLDVISVDASKIQVPTRDMKKELVNYSTGYFEHKTLGEVYLLDLETLLDNREIGAYS